MGSGKVRRVGEVDGDMEEGLCGGFDDGKWSRSPNCGVLAYGGRNGEAGEAAIAMAVEGQVAQDRHGRKEGAKVHMGAQGKRSG